MLNFANKIWNAARFVELAHSNDINGDKSINISNYPPQSNLNTRAESAANQQSLHNNDVQKNSGDTNLDISTNKRLAEIVTTVTKNLHKNQLGVAADTVYNEFWHWYCDQCIEEAKQGKISIKVMTNGLIVFLKLIHPFMPFVTEAVWQELYLKKIVKSRLLMGASWPK